MLRFHCLRVGPITSVSDENDLPLVMGSIKILSDGSDGYLGSTV